MGSFVARFLTNSPGLGEDLFFSVLGQLPARWGEVMWGPFYPKWGPSGKYLPAPGIGLLTLLAYAAIRQVEHSVLLSVKF